ncbi:hypothetical protein J1N35_011901, partial [Gossypium stocksii]
PTQFRPNSTRPIRPSSCGPHGHTFTITRPCLAHAHTFNSHTTHGQPHDWPYARVVLIYLIFDFRQTSFSCVL